LKYRLNALTPFLVYEFGPKFNVAARYRNTQINYVDTDIGDSDENRGIFDLIYNLNRRNSIDLQYQYWQKNYDVGTDYTSNQVKLIFRRQMRAFDIIVGAGYQNRNFEDSNLDDIGKPTFNLTIDGEIIEKRRAYATFSAEQNLNDQSFSADYFLATRFGLSGGYEFTSKLSAGALGAYQISDYQLTSRKDKTFTVSGNVNYRLARWMALNVAVGYESRDSNIDGLNYDNTFVIANLNFFYELGRK
ncbi:MAG: outer membrane beta-barrel protein, partial [Desulfobacterales bacterium]